MLPDLNSLDIPQFVIEAVRTKNVPHLKQPDREVHLHQLEDPGTQVSDQDNQGSQGSQMSQQ